MSTFLRVLRIIGRAIRRAFFAVGRFFKLLFKNIKKTIRVNKLNKTISAREKTIDKLYSEIGRNYYEAHGDEPESLLAALCGGVSENRARVSEAQDTIATILEAYANTKTSAKEKAKARRAADKQAALADKNIGAEPEESAPEAELEAETVETPESAVELSPEISVEMNEPEDVLATEESEDTEAPAVVLPEETVLPVSEPEAEPVAEEAGVTEEPVVEEAEPTPEEPAPEEVSAPEKTEETVAAE